MITVGIAVAVIASLVVGFAAGWGARTQSALRSLGNAQAQYDKVVGMLQREQRYVRELEVKTGTPPRAWNFD